VRRASVTSSIQKVIENFRKIEAGEVEIGNATRGHKGRTALNVYDLYVKNYCHLILSTYEKILRTSNETEAVMSFEALRKVEQDDEKMSEGETSSEESKSAESEVSNENSTSDESVHEMLENVGIAAAQSKAKMLQQEMMKQQNIVADEKLQNDIETLFVRKGSIDPFLQKRVTEEPTWTPAETNKKINLDGKESM